jgi:CRISPR/Cas system-associated exonuclease Cas4 (RecB family)
MWSGLFIHAVMEEAYLMWRDAGWTQFPWNWEDQIRKIEFEINKRLNVQQMYAPSNLFCVFEAPEKVLKRRCPNTNHPHKLIASQRAEMAINTWGKHLFPLISEAEVKLEGLKEMPLIPSGKPRSDYYQITGIIDVLGSVNLQNPENAGNLILHNLQHLRPINFAKFEIIVDYKGMRRPAIDSPEWQWHEWQILTYAHLRELQADSQPVVAGILLYLNELAPSKRDMNDLSKELKSNTTDVAPQYDIDKKMIGRPKNAEEDEGEEEETGPLKSLSTTYKEQRSIRVIPINDETIKRSLGEFNAVVKEIENCVANEMRGHTILDTWEKSGKAAARKCDACDFKTVCPVLLAAKQNGEVKGVATTPTAP